MRIEHLTGLTNEDLLKEGYRDRRDAYQRDYDSSISGMGRPRRDMDDESNLLYIYMDGRLKQKMVSNRVEREARAQGFRDTPEQALKLHGIIRSKFNPKKWVQRQGDKWIEVYPYGKPDDISEGAVKELSSDLKAMSNEEFQQRYKMTKAEARAKLKSKDESINEEASVGAISAASMGTVVNPHHSPGKARGKTSYLGKPGGPGGSKAPPQPKVVQPKTKAGTAVNGLDIKGASLFGGPTKESVVIKRR